jgi:hypothetical protein
MLSKNGRNFIKEFNIDTNKVKKIMIYYLGHKFFSGFKNGHAGWIRARIGELIRSLRIDSKEPIPPGTTTPFLLGSYFQAPIDCLFKIPTQDP